MKFTTPVVTLVATCLMQHAAGQNTYSGNEVEAWSTLFDIIGKDVRSDSKPDWDLCRGTRLDPCKCANNNELFLCTGEANQLRTITQVSFDNNGFETDDLLFPASAIEAFLQAVDTVQTIKITGDTDGLGDATQACVDVPSCETITCDFSPRVLCPFASMDTPTPTTSPTFITVGEGEITQPPTSSPTKFPTSAPTVSQDTAWVAFLGKVGHVKLQNGNPDWLACRGVSSTPCKCAGKTDSEGNPVDATVTCVDQVPNDEESGTITAVEFGDNNFITSDNTFPSEEVNNLLAIGTITTFRLSGNVNGLGDETQGCVEVPLCHEAAISCDFTPRTLCALPTVAPTSSPSAPPTPAQDATPEPTSSPQVAVDEGTTPPSASPVFSPTASPVAPTAAPSSMPTAVPTTSPTALDQLDAWHVLFDALDEVQRDDGKPDWSKCRGSREEPCKCADNYAPFECNLDGEIEVVFFEDVGLSSGGQFPAEAVDFFLGLSSVKNITLRGDEAGLGDGSDGCVQVLKCHTRDIACDFSPRSLCAAPTAAPSLAPTTSPSTAPSVSPSTAPTVSPTAATASPTEAPTAAGTVEDKSTPPTVDSTTGGASSATVEGTLAVVVMGYVAMNLV